MSCAVASSARYLGVELGPGAAARLWASVSSKLFRKAGDIVAAGEAPGTHLFQYKIHGMSLVLYREQLAALDATILEAHRKAQQRLCSALWMAYPPVLLEGLRGIGFASRGHDLRPAATASRLRTMTTSRVFDARLRDVGCHMMSEEALLMHPPHS